MLLLRTDVPYLSFQRFFIGNQQKIMYHPEFKSIMRTRRRDMISTYVITITVIIPFPKAEVYTLLMCVLVYYL